MKLIINICILWFTLTTAVLAKQYLPENSPVPGGVVLIPIDVKTAEEPTVHFYNKRVTVIPNGENWLAIVGLSVKTKPGSHDIKITLKDNKTIKKDFVVKSKSYPEQRLKVKNKRHVDPSQKDLNRIWKEQKNINAAKTSWQDNIPELQMSLPTQGRFSSHFGLKRFFNDKPRNPHRGLDIAAPTGTPIYAPAPGTVVEIGDFFFSGNCIFINHGKGLITYYAHMNKINVKPGQTVKHGELIGEVGSTGRSTGPHLHWSVGLNGVWVDPSLFLLPEDRPKK